MALKCSARSGWSDKEEKVCKSLSLDVKLDNLNRHSQGQGSISIGKSLELVQCTMSVALKNADFIKMSVENISALSVKQITKQDDPVSNKKEQLLIP